MERAAAAEALISGPDRQSFRYQIRRNNLVRDLEFFAL
jgi:hypothetical protein